MTKDFNEFDQCEANIRSGFAALEEMAKNGQYDELQGLMHTCHEIKESDFAHMLGWARNAMVLQAMLDYPYPTDFMAPLPGYPIKEKFDILNTLVCKMFQNRTLKIGSLLTMC